jgi:hypothetical protein
VLWDRDRPPPPLFVVNNHSASASASPVRGPILHPHPSIFLTPSTASSASFPSWSYPDGEGEAEFPVDPDVKASVLDTKWHQCDDAAIQSAISSLHSVQSPADDVPSGGGHPYHSALRVLSAALHNLATARLELEQGRRELQEREEARKKRAEKLMRGEGVSVSEREIARRVLSTVFGDEDGVHGEKEEEDKEREEELLDHVARVRRQPSFMVGLSFLFSPPPHLHPVPPFFSPPGCLFHPSTPTYIGIVITSLYLHAYFRTFPSHLPDVHPSHNSAVRTFLRCGARPNFLFRLVVSSLYSILVVPSFLPCTVTRVSLTFRFATYTINFDLFLSSSCLAHLPHINEF